MENNKRKKAAVLEYCPERGVPILVASGQGWMADKIIERAEENDIPIYQDSKLVEFLNTMEIGEQIPPELFEVVAEILTFVSSVDALLNKEK